MLRKPLLSMFLALLLGGAFAYGLTRLFLLRYEVGDVYPPYSSLRADPLGTKALAEALDELPDVEVRRNFKPLPKLRADRPITLVYTGVPHQAYWTEPEVAAFNALVVGGSRAVFTFFPFENPPSNDDEKRAGEDERARKQKQVEEEQPKAKSKKSKSKKKRATKTEDKTSKENDEEKKRSEFVSFETVAKRWGFAFDFLPTEKKAYDRHAALIEPGGKLEPDLSWHSALYFRDLKPQWKVLYMCGTMPVVIERQYGSGSIVLVADSFLISNEALRTERYPRLLARLFSGPSAVIFDEESHGLRDNAGLASLARKYRLHGVIAGLFLLAILFVWKNAIRFIPAFEGSSAERDFVEGKESSEGFINLLRRSIRPSTVFETCVAEWRKAFALKPRALARVEEIWAQEQARPPRERNAVETYRAISRSLARKN